jgi:hypothetical protein
MKLNRTLFIGMFVMILVLRIVPIVNAQSCEYYISSGKFVFPDGSSVICYSGVPEYRNDPSAINIKFKGPIPMGAFYITDVTTSKGANTIVLRADKNNDMYGRDDDFRIHGDNSSNNASAGCIIMGPSGRQKVVDAYNKARSNGAYLTLYVYR